MGTHVASIHSGDADKGAGGAASATSDGDLSAGDVELGTAV